MNIVIRGSIRELGRLLHPDAGAAVRGSIFQDTGDNRTTSAIVLQAGIVVTWIPWKFPRVHMALNKDLYKERKIGMEEKIAH